MSWAGYTLIAIFIVGFSDLFRKLASNLKDPFFANLVFQLGAFLTGVVLFLLFSRKFEGNSRLSIYALLGGMSVATFTLFSFKALSSGPGVSVVMPALRIGGVMFIALLGVLILKEKLSVQTIFGLLFSAVGIYLLFSNGR